MSTTDSAAESEKSLGVTIVFRSDWGVSTGTGVAGGVDVVVEKDKRDLPVVRGTVLTGAIREQAFVVAEALDGDSPKKRWRKFVGALFGSVKRARLVSFSDACFSSLSDGSIPSDNESRREAVHEVVSLSIDEETGTAKKDHLRLFERARACILRGTVDLLDRTLDGRPLCWSKEQREAAELVLTVSALLVRALGSNRSDGDGLCNILIGETGEIDKRDANPEQVIENAIGQARERCRGRLEQWDGPAPDVPSAPDAPIDSKTGGCSGIPVIRKKNHDHRGDSDGTSFYQADFDIRLTTPVISYDVPFSNELRSLDFLRGTALLPIIHHRLQDVSKEDAAVCEIVRDAVVNGDLLVSDATAVVGDRVGLPMPLVLSTPKVSRAGREWIEVANRLLVEEPEEVHKPLRSGYVFPAADADPARRPDPVGADGADGAGRCPSFAGWSGAPPLTGRQSTAHETATGAAKDGQLFLVRALPAGLTLRATVTMSPALHECVEARLAGLAGRALDANLTDRKSVV